MKRNFKYLDRREKWRIIYVTFLTFLVIVIAVLSPRLFPDTQFSEIIESTIGKFFDIVTFLQNKYDILLETAAIILFIWVLNKIISILTNIFFGRNTRQSTIGHLVASTSKYILVITGLFLILSAWGVQTPTLLASAGIIGLAISFGAQSLIEDIFAGLFIIFERQFAVGDVIQIGDFRGIVKEVGIRITKFENVYGDLKMINNSDIRGAINSSDALSQAVCEIDISYNQDLKKFDKLMRENISALKDDIPTIKKGPFYEGIERFNDSGITVRIIGWVREIDRIRATRELNKHVKLFFDKHKINIPFPQVVINKPTPSRSPAKKSTTKKTTSKSASKK